MLGFDIPCPPGKIILKDSEFDMNEFEYPCVVKPTTTENTVGMSLVPSPDLMQKALDLAFQYGNEVIIDKFIQGREVRCSVIEQIDSLGNLNLLATVPHEYHICQKSLRKTEDKILVDENGLPTGEFETTL